MLVLPLGLCKAQSAPAKPIEPTAIGVVYHLDPTSQELKPLPDEQWRKGTSGNTSPWHPNPDYLLLVISGASSSFRIRVDERAEFVFKTGSPEQVSLYRLGQKDSKRQLAYAKPNNRGGIREPVKGLPVEVSTYGERSYKLVPASPLTPGEYAIIIADEVYTFGVD